MLTRQDSILNDKIEKGMRRAFAVLLASVLCFRIFFVIGEGNVSLVVLFVLYVAGLFTSLLLLLKTHGFHNRMLDRFCGNNSEGDDCLAVIGSKRAFLIGEISWSDIGIIYFLTLIMMLLVFPFDGNEAIFMWSAFLALPYPVFSVYYQWKVIRSWCRLCLMVQLILLLSGGVAVGLWCSEKIIWESADWFSIILLAAFIVTSWFVVKYLVKSLLQKKAVTEQYRLFRSEYATKCLCVSEVLPPVKESARIIYNEKTENKITIAFRFDCHPCLYHMDEIIETIRKNRDIAVEFVFVSWASRLKKDLPVMLYFAMLYYQNSEEFLDGLLRYVSDFPRKSETYAVKPEVIDEQVKNLLVSHLDWCVKNEIHRTPTYLINDRIVSMYYSFCDMVNLLKCQ